MEEDLLVKVVGTSIFSAFFSHLLQPQGPRGDHGVPGALYLRHALARA
jgi:hypothetical protein